MTLKKSQSSDPEADTLVLGLGVCPSIGAQLRWEPVICHQAMLFSYDLEEFIPLLVG